MSTRNEKHREQVQRGNKVKHQATKKLIAAHKREFMRYYAEFAAAEGVTPDWSRHRFGEDAEW